MRNTFNFDGVQSSDYGVYISGSGTFDAPERDFEAVEVPGRNGILTLDNGRFQLQRHKYPAFVVPPFRENVRGLRNALMSKRGAHRLTDTYNPDEYYLAYYERGLEVDPEKNLTVGAMDIIFTRDPRRFLLTGETPVELGAWGQTETDTGDVVSIDSDGTEGIKALSVAITPKQAGSGDPSPTNVRAISGYDSVNVYVSPTTSTADADVTNIQMPSTIYGGTLDLVSGVLTVDRVRIDLGSLSWNYASPRFYANAPADSVAISETGDTALICDSYQTFAVTTLGNMPDKSIFMNSSKMSASVKRFVIRDSTYTAAADLKTALNGVYAVYSLATPETYTLTPEQVELLTGVNNIWSDAGAVTVEHGQNPNVLVNSTLFSARPLIRVYGYGTVTVGDMTVTVAQSSYAYIDIDSEMMDCYHEDDNANGYVSFSTGEFPVLPAGATVLSYSGNITKVIVTPHWWRL